jgi:hypothetical protein
MLTHRTDLLCSSLSRAAGSLGVLEEDHSRAMPSKTWSGPGPYTLGG